jgi:hypothetical protein
MYVVQHSGKVRSYPSILAPNGGRQKVKSRGPKEEKPGHEVSLASARRRAHACEVGFWISLDSHLAIVAMVRV